MLEKLQARRENQRLAEQAHELVDKVNNYCVQLGAEHKRAEELGLELSMLWGEAR